MAKKLGEMWNNLSDSEKQPYINKAAKLKEKYEKVRGIRVPCAGWGPWEPGWVSSQLPWLGLGWGWKAAGPVSAPDQPGVLVVWLLTDVCVWGNFSGRPRTWIMWDAPGRGSDTAIHGTLRALEHPFIRNWNG